jgi:hypothetical protein
MEMARRLVGAATIGVAVLASMVGMAMAHVARSDSSVKITGYIDNTSFLGKVGSERKACKRKRKVTVWKRNPGAMDGPVDTARTDKRGIWAVSAPGADPGPYYATVKKRVRKRKGHKHVCKPDRSPSFKL